MNKNRKEINLTNWKAILKQISIYFDLFQSVFFFGSFISHSVDDTVRSLAENVELFIFLNAQTGVALIVNEK